MKYTKRHIKEAIAYWRNMLHESDMETDLPALPDEDGELEPGGYGSGLQTAKDTLEDFFQKVETAIRAAGVKVYRQKLEWNIGYEDEDLIGGSYLTDLVGEMLDAIESEDGRKGRKGAKGVVMLSMLDDSNVLYSIGANVLGKKRLDCLDEITDLIADHYGGFFEFAGYPLENSATCRTDGKGAAWYENYQEQSRNAAMENAVVSAVNKTLAENGYDFLECFVKFGTDSIWDDLASGESDFYELDDNVAYMHGMGLVTFCLREKNRV